MNESFANQRFKFNVSMSLTKWLYAHDGCSHLYVLIRDRVKPEETDIVSTVQVHCLAMLEPPTGLIEERAVEATAVVVIVNGTKGHIVGVAHSIGCISNIARD